jgi:hypothetical protein
MELLGFMDRPEVAGSWSPSPALDATVGRHTQSTAPTRLADRVPTDVGAEFLKGNIRWTVFAALILIGAGIAALGAWVAQKPVSDREAALAGVQNSAADLRPAVAELTAFNEGLAGIEVDTSSVNESLTRVDGLARQLFTDSASLPQADATSRGLATDASGDALDATKLLREAYAYRAVVLPVLATPSLVTDPELIELDEAVRQFGVWQARFDEVRAALPDEFMAKVTVELDSISTQLEVMLSDYVDALRAGDAAAAQSVAESLQRRLTSAQSILFAALGDVQTRVQRHIDGSLSAIDLLIG